MAGENSEPFSILDSIANAKRQILEGGITSASGNGLSLSFISLESLSELERQETMKNQGPFLDSIRITPYDSRW